MQDGVHHRAPVRTDKDAETATNRVLSRDVLERVLLSTHNLVVLTDPRLEDNPIVWVNDYFCAFTGYRRSEVLGKNCRFLQGSDRDQPARYKLRAAIDAADPCDLVLRNYKKDGTPFYNHLYVSPVCEGNEVAYFVGVQNDVTDREDALSDMRERELHEAMERERERFGMDLHDGLGQELAGIAFLTKAVHQRLEAEQSGYADDIGHVLALIEAAQLSAWHLARGLSPVDASPDGLALALERLCEQVMEAHAELTSRCDVESIAFDEWRAARYLFRIAQEAVSNAAKHARASEIAISLRATDDAVHLEIADDGVGIPQHVLTADPGVMEPPRRGPVGHGMGLYGMRLRAELIGARLAVWPREGGGTVVRCVLPTEAARQRQRVETDRQG